VTLGQYGLQTAFTEVVTGVRVYLPVPSIFPANLLFSASPSLKASDCIHSDSIPALYSEVLGAAN
jgi:hypothetical protein